MIKAKRRSAEKRDYNRKLSLMAQKTNTNPFANQKCMPGLYPINDIAYSCPESEDKVYNSLSDALPTVS